jgi:hypothetical protein
MTVFYIDESGTGLRQPDTPYFVLAALGLSMEHWSDLDRAVVELKGRLVPWAKPEDWELKARDLRRGEGLFRERNWGQRAAAFRSVAEALTSLPVQIAAVRVHKPRLPATIGTEADLYRVAFWRLLDLLVEVLQRHDTGLLMMDSRSDLHSSVQDRRVIDAYRDWCARCQSAPPFAELPWFGFSEFYIGLQMADFCAYMIAFVSNESDRNAPRSGGRELHELYGLIEPKVSIVTLP